MAWKKLVVWTLILLIAGAVPVSAAPVMDCSMPAAVHADSSCCPPEDCGCTFKTAPERSLLGDLPLSLSAPPLDALVHEPAAAILRLPVFKGVPAPAVDTSPPAVRLYDLYSVYRL